MGYRLTLSSFNAPISVAWLTQPSDGTIALFPPEPVQAPDDAASNFLKTSLR